MSSGARKHDSAELAMENWRRLSLNWTRTSRGERGGERAYGWLGVQVDGQTGGPVDRRSGGRTNREAGQKYQRSQFRRINDKCMYT